MKLSIKIGGGFAVLIVIACILGYISIYNMSDIKENSIKLSKEYAPEVDIASSIEKYLILTVNAMNNYILTENDRYHEIEKENLKKFQEYINKAKILAKNSTNLIKLRSELDDIEKKSC